MNRIPGATYRVQLNQGFRFVDARDLVPYLSELGITDLYTSPLYKARRGSSHGYDIANPLRINSELGTEEDFDDLASKLQHYGMGLLLDTVPNHMAATYENPWWRDVLENGQASAFADYFDIDWHPPETKAAFLQENRILLPVLGDLYGKVLERGEFALKIEDTGIDVRYYDKRLPLDPKTYAAVLERLPRTAEAAALHEALARLPGRDETSTERVMERRREGPGFKDRLWRAYQADAEMKAAVDEALLAIAESADQLHALLERQAYRLAYWKIGYEEINYRRFFDINELVGLRIEEAEVFENRYQQTLNLVRQGKITGLRIDHIDGLCDPACYLGRLAGPAGDLYIVVEKILGRDEELPAEWPVAGTTGYDFLNAVNGIFVDPAGLAKLEEIYARFTGFHLPFAEVCYQATKEVIKGLFRGDFAALARHLGRLAARHREARDVPLTELAEALAEVTACLPVYRTYIREGEISGRDRATIRQTMALARRRTSAERIPDAAFDFIAAVLLVDPPPYLDPRRRDWLNFVMRWQQFTGPVMAKGVEDTANYRHTPLLSLNEVGGDGIGERPPCDAPEFHALNQRRLECWPATLNATATHDTKRGEDSRARLNVLSEMPAEWERRLERWMEWNMARKETVGGGLAPGAAEEILIYQTLLSVWPCEWERVEEFLVKALREAKQNSSWIAPHEAYEQAVVRFVRRILEEDGPFTSDFFEFAATVGRLGARNGLAQLVLKVAAPGVPDFYQGTELWQFALVDPDNRRPVDYKHRAAMLDELRRREAEEFEPLIRQLAATPEQDETKLWITYRALAFRKAHAELFAHGEYIPLQAQGACARHVVAFARRHEDRWAAAVAPRWTSQVTDWADTELLPPPGAPGEWVDALTGRLSTNWLLRDLVAVFPAALLRAN